MLMKKVFGAGLFLISLCIFGLFICFCFVFFPQLAHVTAMKVNDHKGVHLFIYSFIYSFNTHMIMSITLAQRVKWLGYEMILSCL